MKTFSEKLLKEAMKLEDKFNLSSGLIAIITTSSNDQDLYKVFDMIDKIESNMNKVNDLIDMTYDTLEKICIEDAKTVVRIKRNIMKFRVSAVSKDVDYSFEKMAKIVEKESLKDIEELKIWGIK